MTGLLKVQLGPSQADLPSFPHLQRAPEGPSFADYLERQGIPGPLKEQNARSSGPEPDAHLHSSTTDRSPSRIEEGAGESSPEKAGNKRTKLQGEARAEAERGTAQTPGKSLEHKLQGESLRNPDTPGEPRLKEKGSRDSAASREAMDPGRDKALAKDLANDLGNDLAKDLAKKGLNKAELSPGQEEAPAAEFSAPPSRAKGSRKSLDLALAEKKAKDAPRPGDSPGETSRDGIALKGGDADPLKSEILAASMHQESGEIPSILNRPGQSQEAAQLSGLVLEEDQRTLIQVIDLRTASGRLKALRQEARQADKPGPSSGADQTQGASQKTESLKAAGKALLKEALPGQAEGKTDTSGEAWKNFMSRPGHSFGLAAGNTSFSPWSTAVLQLWGQASLSGRPAGDKNSQNLRVSEMDPGSAQAARASQQTQLEIRAAQVNQGAAGATSNLAEYLKSAGAYEIVRSAKFILKDNDRGQIKLILKPENLGQVKIDLNLEDKRIAGKILVENKDVEEAFLQTAEDLRAAFILHGFEDADLSIEFVEAGAIPQAAARDRGSSGNAGASDESRNRSYESPEYLNYGIDLAI